MNPAERKIQQLEQQLSRIKDEKSLYYCIAQAAERREAQASASANTIRAQLLKERALRIEAERRLQEEIKSAGILQFQNQSAVKLLSMKKLVSR